MEIRTLSPTDDATRAGRLVQDAYFALDNYPRDEYYDALLADVAGRADEVDVVVAIVDDQIVGCLSFVPELTGPHAEFDDPDAASFRYFGIDPAVQGLGIGEAMVRWCIDEARRLGRRRLRIHTLESMLGAQRMYTKMGFVRTPDLDGDWDGIVGLAFAYEL